MVHISIQMLMRNIANMKLVYILKLQCLLLGKNHQVQRTFYKLLAMTHTVFFFFLALAMHNANAPHNFMDFMVAWWTLTSGLWCFAEMFCVCLTTTTQKNSKQQLSEL